MSSPHRNCVIIVFVDVYHPAVTFGDVLVFWQEKHSVCLQLFSFSFLFFPPLVLIGLPGMLFGLPCSLELNFVFLSLYCLLSHSTFTYIVESNHQLRTLFSLTWQLVVVWHKREVCSLRFKHIDIRNYELCKSWVYTGGSCVRGHFMKRRTPTILCQLTNTGFLRVPALQEFCYSLTWIRECLLWWRCFACHFNVKLCFQLLAFSSSLLATMQGVWLWHVVSC